MTHGGRHLRILNKLAAILSQWVAERAAFLQVQCPIIVDDQSEPEPDCSLVSGKPDDVGDSVPRATAVLGVFEVADSSLRTDRRTKLRLYAESSIAIYVIVNLKDNLIEVHSDPIPTESRYEIRGEYGRGDSVEIPIGNLGVLPIVVQDLL